MKTLRESILDIDKTIDDVKIMGDINEPMTELFDSFNSPDIKQNAQKLIDNLTKSGLAEELDGLPTTKDLKQGYYVVMGFSKEHECFNIYKNNPGGRTDSHI